MNIRQFQPGDEEIQAAIYNEAADRFPRFKPATGEEVRRRCQAADFDPATRFYVESGGRVVAYATFQDNGRVSYPWCRPGHEAAAEPLFQRVLDALRLRGLAGAAFAAYREDWGVVHSFFQRQGFSRTRDMVNFLLDLGAMPTAPRQPAANLTPLEKRDLPALLHLGRSVLRTPTEDDLEKYLFANPYFKPDSVFVLRDRQGGLPLAAGLFITNLDYADPRQLDPLMPCFRLGAFGTEGLTTKRINGMFSILAPDRATVQPRGLGLLSHVAYKVPQHDQAMIAAQVASDATHLLEFYQTFFQRQGSFPVFTKELG